MLFVHNEHRLVLSQDPENFPLRTSSILLYLTSPFLVKSAICDSAVLLSNALKVPIIAIVENPGPCYHRLYRFLYGNYRITTIGINTRKVCYHQKDIIVHFSIYFSANIVLAEYLPMLVKNEHQFLTPAHELSMTFSLLLRNTAVFYLCPYPLRLRTGPLQVAHLSNTAILWDTRSQIVTQQGMLPGPEFMKAIRQLPSHSINYPQYSWISPLISAHIHIYDVASKREVHEISLPQQLKDCMQLWVVENGSCLIREIQYSSNVYLMLRGIILFMIVNSGLSIFHTHLQSSNKQHTTEASARNNQDQRAWKDMDAQFEALSSYLDSVEKNMDQPVGESPQELSGSLTHMCSELLHQLTNDSGYGTMSHVVITAYLGYIPLEALLLFASKQRSGTTNEQEERKLDSADTFTSVYTFALRETSNSGKIKEGDPATPQYLLWLLYNSHVRKLYLEMLRSLDITLCPIVSQQGLLNFSERVLSVLQIQLLFALCSSNSLNQYLLFLFRTSYQYARQELTSPMPLVSRQYLAYNLTILDVITILSPIYRKMVYLYSLRYVECVIFNVYGRNASQGVPQQLTNLLPDFHSVSNRIRPE